MRIWDLPPAALCREHLLAEHRELHAVWSIITQRKKGYAHHPETQRWRGKLKALYLRHGLLVNEMEKRGFKHQTPLDKRLAKGSGRQNVFLNTPGEQREILRKKGCQCRA